MPGMILGVYGKQRSGKTLFSYLICKAIKKWYEKETKTTLRFYSNIWAPDDDIIYVSSVDDLPLDLEPKIVLLDEIYNGTDAQNYKTLSEISIYINTIGKQNCFFIFTSIDPSEVYNRIRNQMRFVVFVRSDDKNIYYRITDLDNGKFKDFTLCKTEEFFTSVKYDTNFIPVKFDWNMKRWKNKLRDFV